MHIIKCSKCHNKFKADSDCEDNQYHKVIQKTPSYALNNLNYGFTNTKCKGFMSQILQINQTENVQGFLKHR